MCDENHPVFENLRFLTAIVENDSIPEFGKEFAKQEITQILTLLN
jgi:hypothetical protein